MFKYNIFFSRSGRVESTSVKSNNPIGNNRYDYSCRIFCTTKYEFEPLTFYGSNDNIHIQIFELR